jgi:hypothetical protein
VPRVAVSASGTIWVAAYGWGRGPYDEDHSAPMVLLVFDEHGALGPQRELPAGVRVRAMAALSGDRVAIAGQSAKDYTHTTAFVAACDARAVERWHTALPSPFPSFVESIAVDGDRVFVGGNVDSTLEEDPTGSGPVRGREGDGFVVTVRAGDGSIAETWKRHYAGVNVNDVRVAVANGAPYVAYNVGLRRGNPWPADLPPGPAGIFAAIIVEPMAAKPAWRRMFAGTTHATVMSLAGSKDRLALVADVQAGAIDFGRGAWESKYFDLGAYVELASATGDVAEARKLSTSAPGEVGRARIFMHRVIWDGSSFDVVGQANGTVQTALAARTLDYDAPFLWRIGAVRVAQNDRGPYVTGVCSHACGASASWRL